MHGLFLLFCSVPPPIPVTSSLRITYHWIKSQIEAEEKQSGVDRSKYAHSMVVGTLKPTDLGTLRQQDGQEVFEEKKN